MLSSSIYQTLTFLNSEGTKRVSEPADFITFNKRVLFQESFLELLLIVKWALMILCIPMLSTEHVVTFARESKQSNLFPAGPTSIFVLLLKFVNQEKC